MGHNLLFAAGLFRHRLPDQSNATHLIPFSFFHQILITQISKQFSAR